jgi:deoxyribodipyrimidine photo-lyase
MTLHFDPSRHAALSALSEFLPRAGRDYALDRNHDRGPADRRNVSALSPFLRHRLLTEREVAEAVLERHSLAASEKFVQEVFWRTYWKGWLELRPEAWRRYRRDVAALVPGIGDAEWSAGYARACEARTGIECFDAWVTELAEFGYLHNHTRMWFASIWIFTLGLPWQLGADLFYRQLLDGDAASNTLSWRWVAGLQTAGKTYLARPDNIERFTDGRFSPTGLASVAPALEEPPLPVALSLEPAAVVPGGDVGLLMHEEDLHLESLPLGGATVRSIAGWHGAQDRSPLGCSDSVATFTAAAMGDGLTRASAHFGVDATALSSSDATAVFDWARENGVTTIVTPFAPVGPVRERLDALSADLAAAGVSIVAVRREWDSLAWPHASRGFFPFRERIPALLAEQGIGGPGNRA